MSQADLLNRLLPSIPELNEILTKIRGKYLIVHIRFLFRGGLPMALQAQLYPGRLKTALPKLAFDFGNEVLFQIC